MQFKNIALVAAALAIAPVLVENVNYEGFASTVECSGSSFGCINGGAVCCSLPTGFGFSAQFNDLPAGTQGQGYTDNGCTDFKFSVFGPGTKCINLGGNRATNLNWFHSPSDGGRRAVKAREAEIAANACSTPAYFKYQAPSCIQRTIKVPTGDGAAQTIADLYLAHNLTALASYEDY